MIRDPANRLAWRGKAMALEALGFPDKARSALVQYNADAASDEALRITPAALAAFCPPVKAAALVASQAYFSTAVPMAVPPEHPIR